MNEIPLKQRAHFYTGEPLYACALRGKQPGRWKSGLFCVTAFRTRDCIPCAAYAAIGSVKYFSQNGLQGLA